MRLLALALPCALLACAGEPPLPGRAHQVASVSGDSDLVPAFQRAERTSGVPAALLAAIAQVETRFSQSAGQGAAASEGGPHAIGVMALGSPARALGRAARLAGLAEADVRESAAANVLAAAALLADDARSEYGEVPGELEAWRPILVRFGGGGVTGSGLADDVLGNLERGIRGQGDDGRKILVPAVRLYGSEAGIGHTSQALAGFANAIWNPAYTGNYQHANRTAADIQYIVIHTTEGSYGGTINWFQDPAAMVSANYVVRSSDGQITHMVNASNIAWHDACFNTHSVGIEHEGFVADPGRWYTDAMYRSSARLTAWLADQYGIPKDRAHIMGHGEAPDCSDHTDPGPGWDWTKYMDLVRGGGEPIAPSYAASLTAHSEDLVLAPGQEGVGWVELKNDGSATWDINGTRLGTASPRDRESEWFKAGNWLSANRATAADQATAPGKVGRFSFVIKAPAATATTVLHEKFQLVQEGVTWFGPTVELTLTVQPEWLPLAPAKLAEGGPGEASGCAVVVGAAGGAPLAGFGLCLLGLGLLRRSRRRTAVAPATRARD